MEHEAGTKRGVSSSRPLALGLHCLSNWKLSNILDIVNQPDHSLTVLREDNSGITRRADLC